MPLLTFLLIATQSLALPMDTTRMELLLNPSIDSTHCGVWETGDYKISIPLQSLKDYFEENYLSLIGVNEKEPQMDSATYNRYKIYADRYLVALNQLKAANHGFDLRQLVLYVGLENIEYNKGSSAEIELFVRSKLEKGDAIVQYKGQRINKMNIVTHADLVMSTIKMYYDDENNFAFSYFGYINW